MTRAKGPRKKFEARNPKFETNLNDKNTKILNGPVSDFEFRFYGFRFVSDLVLRILGFAFKVTVNA
jgi:hypothetical protein